MKMTVNEMLVVQKAIRGRMMGLTALRSSVANRESYLYGKDNQKVVEPQYDVKKVDKKISEMERFLMKSDAAIKKSNAVTEIDLDVNTDELLNPIE